MSSYSQISYGFFSSESQDAKEEEVEDVRGHEEEEKEDRR